jgi:hypothetical protein
VYGILLVTCEEYSQCTASYWSPVRDILGVRHPIGHLWGIFSVYGVLLVTCEGYSRCTASYWSPVRNILSVRRPIGHV